MEIVILLIVMFGLLFFGWKFLQILIMIGDLSKIQRALFILDAKDSQDLMKKLNITNKDIYHELIADSVRALQQAKREGSLSLEKEVSKEGDIREL